MVFLPKLDLEKEEFLKRHFYLADLLAKRDIKVMIDIGAYYNPIHLFFQAKSCIDTVIIIEPILDALSVRVPCSDPSNQGKYTHYLFLPITFKHYIAIKEQVPMPETVVCIGCDSHYGPNRRMLETTFKKPYALYIEYPSEYVHNAAYKKMNGDGPGEQLVNVHKYNVHSNETIYTKRVMKVIEYQ